MNYPTSREIINRVKSIKKSNGITNPELAQMAGIPLGTLNRVLSGANHDIGITMMAKLAQTLNASLDYLVFGNGAPGSSTRSSEEYQLLLTFRSLDEEGREKLLDQGRILEGYCKYKYLT